MTLGLVQAVLNKNASEFNINGDKIYVYTKDGGIARSAYDLADFHKRCNEWSKAIDWLKVEQDYRNHLSFKYTSYMTSAMGNELNLLASLVDGRYPHSETKYSTMTKEEAYDDIMAEINSEVWKEVK